MKIALQSGYTVHISEGNRKVGQIPSFSLTPGRSCSAEACKTCLCEGCYALKAYRMYKQTHTAYDDNTAAVLGDLAGVEAALMRYFGGMTAPRFFRVHVAGDFITREYAAMWARIAAANPHTRFLAFTKQWAMVRGIDMPDNLQVVLSAWPGTEIPADLRGLYPVAWLIGRDDPDSVPDNTLLCPGDCEHCGMCWTLGRAHMDVAFYKH